MTLLSIFQRRTSAPVARERLQILLAHERAIQGRPDLLGLLRDEILAVVSRHIVVDNDRISVKTSRSDEISTLEIDIDMPNASRARVKVHM